MKKGTIERLIQGAIGLYLVLPGVEDAATGGALVLPSIVVGAALLADAAGVKLPKL